MQDLPDRRRLPPGRRPLPGAGQHPLLRPRLQLRRHLPAHRSAAARPPPSTARWPPSSASPRPAPATASRPPPARQVPCDVSQRPRAAAPASACAARRSATTPAARARPPPRSATTSTTTATARPTRTWATSPAALGECRRAAAACANGSPAAPAPRACPRAETCNGRDDNCDGVVDNGFEPDDQRRPLRRLQQRLRAHQRRAEVRAGRLRHRPLRGRLVRPRPRGGQRLRVPLPPHRRRRSRSATASTTTATASWTTASTW